MPVHSDVATHKQGLSLSNNLFPASQSGDPNPLPTYLSVRERESVCGCVSYGWSWTSLKLLGCHMERDVIRGHGECVGEGDCHTILIDV